MYFLPLQQIGTNALKLFNPSPLIPLVHNFPQRLDNILNKSHLIFRLDLRLIQILHILHSRQPQFSLLFYLPIDFLAQQLNPASADRERLDIAVEINGVN
jgi:hypothetical protein